MFSLKILYNISSPKLTQILNFEVGKKLYKVPELGGGLIWAMPEYMLLFHREIYVTNNILWIHEAHVYVIMKHMFSDV